MATLEQFGRNMRVRATVTTRRINSAVEEISTAVGSGVVFNTPVDTGEGRSNWVAGLGGPSSRRRLVAFRPYPALKSAVATLLAGRFYEVANALAAVSDIRRVVRGRRLGQSVWISNNAADGSERNYIARLNRGERPITLQVPPDFVHQGVLNGLSKVKRIRIIGR